MVNIWFGEVKNLAIAGSSCRSQLWLAGRTGGARPWWGHKSNPPFLVEQVDLACPIGFRTGTHSNLFCFSQPLKQLAQLSPCPASPPHRLGPSGMHRLSSASQPPMSAQCPHETGDVCTHKHRVIRCIPCALALSKADRGVAPAKPLLWADLGYWMGKFGPHTFRQQVSRQAAVLSLHHLHSRTLIPALPYQKAPTSALEFFFCTAGKLCWMSKKG